MRTMNSRKLGILLFAGVLAGGTAVAADGVPFADWDDWKTVGTFATPAGYSFDTIFSIAVAPSDSRVIVSLMDLNPGMFRSDNGGADWTRIGDGNIFNLAMNPTEPDVMLGTRMGG